MESRRNSRSYLNPDYYAQTVAIQGPNMLTLHAQRIHQILDNEVEESHPLFSELEILEAVGDDFEWRENARWIKFEEDVEEGGNRWSKPHVSSLSLHAMFELKEVILHGTIILDIEGETLEQIVEIIVNNLINNNKLHFSQRERIKEVLLKKHRHQHQRKHHSLAKKGAEKNYYVNTTIKKDGDSPVYSEDESQNTVTEKPKYNLAFMRKVPPNAETSNIMVGHVACLDQPLVILVRLKNSCVIGNLTEVPVPTRFMFILLVPNYSSLEFFEIGRAMGTLMSDEVFHEVAYKAKNKSDIIFGIEEFMHAVTVLPPGEWDPTIRIEPPAAIPSQDPRKRPPEKEPNEEDEELEAQRIREQTGLARTGKLFGGLRNDLKRKLPWYWSDFKDALSTQSIASWIFLYFACLSPTITFGGLLGEATGHNMGAMESMVSSFICGVGYGFFSGQPLTILGSTGPLLVFEAIIYDFCMTYSWDYLTFRFWIGTWVAVILLILVAIDASAYVCYITRFTEENFAALIALIFIYEAVEKVLSIGEKFPMNTTGNPNVTLNSSCSCMVNITGKFEKWAILNTTECEAFGGFLEGEACFHPPFVPDVFLFSILLTMGTFIISIKLKESKNALFFSSSVRTFLSDFAVIIAIASMTLVDFWYKVPTPKLDVPQEFKPTLPFRGWIISPFNQLNPFWSIFFAIAPALLGTILIFMDQQITAVIVNRKEYKLKKGCGYHLDLFVLAILIQICTFMGLPWLVAATVRSINHVNSLKLESECAAPGEKPQFLGVREQRATNILVFLTVGVSVFLTPFLRHIPMPVLFGVFLYMGISALNDLQLFDRILIVFMPKKYQPDYMFLRQVPVKRVHLFTFIQLSSLISLWLIKSFHQTSILFPLWLVVMVGIRKALDSIFTRRELKILDDLMPTNPKRHVTNGKPGFLGKVSRFFLGPKLVQIDPKYQRCSVIEKETAA